MAIINSVIYIMSNPVKWEYLAEVSLTSRTCSYMNGSTLRLLDTTHKYIGVANWEYDRDGRWQTGIIRKVSDTEIRGMFGVENQGATNKRIDVYDIGTKENPINPIPVGSIVGASGNNNRGDFLTYDVPKGNEYLYFLEDNLGNIWSGGGSTRIVLWSDAPTTTMKLYRVMKPTT